MNFYARVDENGKVFGGYSSSDPQPLALNEIEVSGPIEDYVGKVWNGASFDAVLVEDKPADDIKSMTTKQQLVDKLSEIQSLIDQLP